MFAKAHLAVQSLKARGFEVVSKFTSEDSVFLLRENWGVAVPKSEKVWKASGGNPLWCFRWGSSTSESEKEEIDKIEEEEIEDYFILLEEAEQKRKLFFEKIGAPYHPF